MSLASVLDREPRLGEYTLRLTWSEYLALEDPAGLRLEFDEGRLLVSLSGRTAHDVVRDLLRAWLITYEEAHPGSCFVVAEHSFFMPPGERDLRPDVAVIVDERKDRPLAPDQWLTGAPDIAVEVLSPSTEGRDLGLKARRYFEQGSDEYWVLDPVARTAHFHRRGTRGWEEVTPNAGGLYSTPLLPGFELSLPRLWARLEAKLHLPPNA